MKLVIKSGGAVDKEFVLEPGSNLIGRWDAEHGSFPEIDLEAEDADAKVSRKHSMVVYRDGKATVEDLQSLNGTYLNRDTKLEAGVKYPLKAGDELLIGSILFKVSE